MIVTWRKTLQHWTHGIRFYIAIGIGLLTFETWVWAAAEYGGSNLFAIRLEEAYAWIAVSLLVTAVSIGPVCRVFKRLPGKQLAYDARRLLGIGAAWFSTLHVAIAYKSLFEFANPLKIPVEYQRAFLVGTIASLILLAMAFTSFNAAMRRMGPWWFRLHRFVYLAVLSVMLHAFMIGSHAAKSNLILAFAIVAGVILLLHSIGIVKQGKPATSWQLVTLGTMTAAVVIVLSFGSHQRSQYQRKANFVPQGGNNAQAY